MWSARRTASATTSSTTALGGPAGLRPRPGLRCSAEASASCSTSSRTTSPPTIRGRRHVPSCSSWGPRRTWAGPSDRSSSSAGRSSPTVAIPYFPAWPDVVQLNAFSAGAARRGRRDPARHRRPVRRCPLRHGDADDGRRLRAHLGRPAGRPPPDATGRGHRARVRRSASGLRVRGRGVLGPGVGPAAAGLRLLLRQAAVRPPRARDAPSGAAPPPGRPDSYQTRLRPVHREPRRAPGGLRVRPGSSIAAAAIATLTQTGARLVHDGQPEGRKVHLPMFLGRFPRSPAIPSSTSFYESLLSALSDPTFRRGQWHLCERSGWAGNDSAENLVTWCWDGDTRWLVVVNLSGAIARPATSGPPGTSCAATSGDSSTRPTGRPSTGRATISATASTCSWRRGTGTCSESSRLGDTGMSARERPAPRSTARLAEATGRPEDDLFTANPWYEWGPYLAERAWGTVREDYSDNGDAWDSFPHDHARSRAYRWNEDGMAGISDIRHELCLALALWNGTDPILKERMFGLTGPQGNHGEDVKEYWWYLDGLPSHAWLRWRYHYPQAAFPYQELIDENGRRGFRRSRVRAARHRRVRRRALLDRRRLVRESIAHRGAGANHGREPRAGVGRARRAPDVVVPQHLALVQLGRRARAVLRRTRSPSSTNGWAATASKLRPRPTVPEPEARVLQQRDQHRPPLRRRADHALSERRDQRPRGPRCRDRRPATPRARRPRGGTTSPSRPASGSSCGYACTGPTAGGGSGRRRLVGHSFDTVVQARGARRRRVLRGDRARRRRCRTHAHREAVLRGPRLEQADVPVSGQYLARR